MMWKRSGKTKRTDFSPIRYKYALEGYPVYAAGGVGQGKGGKSCTLLMKISPEERQQMVGLDNNSHVTCEGRMKVCDAHKMVKEHL